MPTVEAIGIDAVADMIRQSKLSKFKIHRRGEHRNTTPVFENSSRSAAESATAFVSWATVIMKYNADNDGEYEITLWGKYNASSPKDPNDDDETKGVRFSFMLCEPKSAASAAAFNAPPPAPYMAAPDPQDIERRVNEAVEAAILRMELKAAKEKIQELEDELDEVGDASGSNSLLPYLSAILGKKGAPVAEPAAAINDNAGQIQQQQRLNTAIAKLHRADTEIIDHLEKLADIAENSPDTFAMLINMLEGF